MSYSIHAIALTAAAVPALMFAAPVSAQGLVGTWDAKIPMRATSQNGQAEQSEFAPVTITIEQRGDSLFATWKAGAMAGRPEQKERLVKGVLKDGAAVLTGEPTEARITRNGEESVAKMTTVFTFKVDGDVLDGKMVTSSADSPMPPQEREFKATRRKS